MVHILKNKIKSTWNEMKMIKNERRILKKSLTLTLVFSEVQDVFFVSNNLYQINNVFVIELPKYLDFSDLRKWREKFHEQSSIRNYFSEGILLTAVIGNPSFSFSSLTFFSATVSFFSLSSALYTCP